MTTLALQTVLAQLDTVAPRREALAYLKAQASSSVKVADRYDDDADLREAIALLMPNFEYPDISYLTLAQLHYKCRKLPDPAIVQLKTFGVQQALSNVDFTAATRVERP